VKSAIVPTVFIIDDDRGMRQSVQDLVESIGLRAEAFATGQEFLNRKRTSGPSCLVLDVRLPQISGLDFQRQLAETGIGDCGLKFGHCADPAITDTDSR
jgi:FixJ family two-component response regulator